MNPWLHPLALSLSITSSFEIMGLFVCDFVVVLLFYVHGKHIRSCRDGQLT